MEDSDGLIINQIKQLGFPIKEDVDQLGMIDGDILKNVMITFIVMMGGDREFLDLKDSNQKFRVNQKVCDELNKNYGIRCDFNILMNPSKNDIRKILVEILSKVIKQLQKILIFTANKFNDEKQNMYMSYDEKIEQESKSEKQEILQNWLNDEWILPQLNEKCKQEFRSYETTFNNQNQDMLNKKLLMDIFDDHCFSNFQNSLSCQLQKDQYLKAHKEALKLEQHQREINRKQLDIDFLEKNKLIWQKSQQMDQFRFKKVEIIDEQLDNNLNKQTIFNLEMEFTQDSQTSEIKEFDINAMKNKNKNEIDELLQTLIERKDQIEKIFLKKQQILEDIEKSKNTTTNYKQNSLSLQQQVQQLESLFEHINDQNLRDQLIQDKLEMQSELDQMEKDWEEHKAQMQADFDKFMRQKELKKEKQMKLKIKLQNIDEDYEKLLQKMFSNENQIQNLQEQYKKATKDITRSMYLKKIKDINTNLQKQRVEFDKIQKELQDIQKSVQFNCTQLTRISTEIENIFMMDPKRNDSINKLINNIYLSFKQSFDTTFENSQEMQKVKLKARELEVKLDQLLGKNYNENSEKIKVGLEEIQKENKQMEKLIAKKQKAFNQQQQ